MSLVATGLTKTYGAPGSAPPALDDVSLGVDTGEVVALVGNNGAGKSTLMSIVAGLVPADSGRAVVMGHETTRGGGSPTRQLGLAPQEEALYPTLTARRNLGYFGTLAGLDRRALEARIEQVAAELMLSDLLDRKAVELSGGQRRRLHTGLALMHSPEVLLLDEPTVGVDIDARVQLLRFVRDSAAGGAAILYSTHQMTEVEQIASRAVVLHEGRVLAAGSVDELVETHAAPAAELRFGRPAESLPEGLMVLPELSRGADGHDTIIVVGLDDDRISVPDLVATLPAGVRGDLLSAEVRAPSFERAYLSLLRQTGAKRDAAGAHGVAS